MSTPTPIPTVRVSLSAVEDARRAVFSLLEDLPEAKRSRLAQVIAARLRDAGLLASSLEEHFSATDVAALLHRSPDWVARMIKRGEFGACSRDGEWLVPASGVQGYLTRRLFQFSEDSEVAA